MNFNASHARVLRLLEEAPRYVLSPAIPLYLASANLEEVLDGSDYARILIGENSAHQVEHIYQQRIEHAVLDAAARALAELETSSFNPSRFDFLPIVLEHSVAAMAAGIRSAEGHYSRLHKFAEGGVPRARVPRSLPELFNLWDKWRKGIALPARQARNARVIKDVFLKTVHEFWKTHSDDYRKGRKFTQEEVRAELGMRARLPMARASMIVATETTVFYNTARRELYDQADGVTHYLFSAIRDRRTSKWCTGYQKGGRDGLVYRKGSPYLMRETPACHWNCRSTILPLSPSNPRHLVLIEDHRRARWSNSPTPLPTGWNGRAARVG